MDYVTPLLVLGAALSQAAPTETVWHQNYGDSLKQVREVDKPLFIVFGSASSEFGKMTDNGPFVNTQIEERLSADYVRLYVNPESERGKTLTKLFKVETFPFIAVIDRSGKQQVYRRAGSHTPERIDSLLAQYRTAKSATAPTIEVSVEKKSEPLQKRTVERPITSTYRRQSSWDKYCPS